MTLSVTLERRHLGKSGLEAAVVGMGTWRTFDVRGGKVERDRASLVERAVTAGVDLFDSSPMYGEAERVLGQSLAPVRDRVLVATKVWSADDAVAARQIAAALDFFGGRVDLYQVHNLVAAPRRLDMLEALKVEGRVGAVGATHYSESAFGQLRTRDGERAHRRHPDSLQPAPTSGRAGDPSPGRGAGLGVLVMRPFGEGDCCAGRPAPAALAPLAEFGVTTWPQALLKWVLSDPRCHVAIPATSSPDHLIENLEAASPPWFGERSATWWCGWRHDGARS